MNDGIGSEGARILAAQRMEAQAVALVGAPGRTPAARADAARRVATGEARALLDAAQAIYWGVVEAHDRQIRGAVRGMIERYRLTAAEDDILQTARIGWLRGLRRWRADAGAAPAKAGRWGALAEVQRGDENQADLTVRCKRGWGWDGRAARIEREDGSSLLIPAPSPDVDRALDLDRLRQSLAGLSERHARIALAAHEVGAVVVAAQEGCTHQRISQIRAQTEARLRAAMGVNRE